jgi:hypothetical protein
MVQGFDVCDEGFALSSYQQVFLSPKSIEYNMPFWLTTITGGLWLQMFPTGGILSFRILGAITLIITMLISYRILLSYFNKKHILISLLMLMLSMGFGVVNYSYNTLSGLLSVAIMFFLFRGLINNSKFLILISGALTGLSMFASLPTITIAAQLLTIIFYQIINIDHRRRYTIQNTSLYCAGIIIGISFILLLMDQIGHLEIYKKSIISITNHATESDSNHNLSILAKKYAKDYLNVTKMGLLWICISAVLGFCKPFCNTRTSSVLWYSLTILFNIFIIWNNSIFITYFITLTSTLIIALDSQQNKPMRMIAFGAFVTAFFLPIGTDPGIHSIGHSSMWIGLPFFFLFIKNIKKVELFTSSTTSSFSGLLVKKTIGLMIIIFVSSFFLVKSFQIANGAYFDPGCRINKTSQIHSNLSHNIYTTAHRAKIINHILKEVSQVVKPNDYLLVYDKLPMLYYLTQTRPYVYNPWIWTYDSYSFKRQLKRAESEIKAKPFVIVQKFETIYAFSEPIEDYLNENKPDTYLNRVENHKALKEFLTRNKYIIYTDSDYFTIYKPEQ